MTEPANNDRMERILARLEATEVRARKAEEDAAFQFSDRMMLDRKRVQLQHKIDEAITKAAQMKEVVEAAKVWALDTECKADKRGLLEAINNFKAQQEKKA